MTDNAHPADNDAPIHGVTCTCGPDCRPGGACRWVGCCRSPIERARVTPPEVTHCANCGAEVPTDRPHKVGECVTPHAPSDAE